MNAPATIDQIRNQITLAAAGHRHEQRGYFSLADLPQKPPIGDSAISPGWDILAEIWKLYPGQFTIVTGSPGHGKALAIDTKIPTPAGLVDMGEIQVGDVVFDETGRPCNVVAVSEVMFGRDCFELEFDDGVRVIADAEHQWLTISERARQSAHSARKKRGNRDETLPRGTDQRHKRTFPSVVTTRLISETLICRGKRNHHVPLAGALDGAEMSFIIHPYTLGVWLGDGTSAAGHITCFEEVICDRLAANGEVVRAQATTGRFHIGYLKARLRAVGLLNNKHIPETYQRASIKQRLALLRGLMDTDGSCRKSDRVCEYTSVNETLARGVYRLVCGLGLKATFLTGDAKLNGKTVSKKYRVCFIADFPVFSLPRKIAAQRVGNGHRTKNRVIVGCRRVASVPVRCIQVDSPSRLFLATEACVPTHNSTLMLNVVCNIAKTHDWRTFMYVPENESFLQYKLRRIYGNRGFEHFARNQCFVQSAEVQTYNQAPKSIDWVLDRAVVGIKRDGVKLLMIDPWNELEHAKPRDWTMTEYITHCLMYLKQFVRAYGVAVIVVAHPTKSHASEGRQPTLYDIESSAAWFNKCDNGLIVSRDPETDQMNVTSAKVRERGAGKRGKCLLLVNEYEQVTDLSGVVI